MSSLSVATPKEPQPQLSGSGVIPPPSAASPQEPTFKVYKPPGSGPALAPLPDDYFNMTTADIKAAQQTLSARASAMVNAPLQLRTIREASQQAKLDRWQNTAIRIKFSDRTQLERSFPSTDKIKSIYAFVRGCLREDVKPIKFILYQSPPKRDLKVSDPKVRDQTLAQLQLSPSSVLLLRFEDDALNGSNVPAPLAPEILSQAIDFPIPPDFDAKDGTSPSESSKPRKSASGKSGSSTDGVEKKLQKWLKLGPKK